MHNDFTSLSYLACSAAQRAGVPEFTLQHGFPSQEYFPVAASHYLVWGPRFAHYMKERGGGTSQYACVGAPRLDSVVSSPERQRAARQKLRDMGLAQERRLNVLFLSQSHSALFSRQEHGRVLSLVAALARESWIRLLIRRHPQESVNTLKGYPGFTHSPVVPAQLPLADSVLGADVVLSVNSTAMLESALLGVPVIQIAFPEFGDRLGLLRFPRLVSDLDSARLLLRQLCRPLQRQAVVYEQQELLQDCVSAPGHGTAAAWSYIQANSGEKPFCPPAAVQGTS